MMMMMMMGIRSGNPQINGTSWVVRQQSYVRKRNNRRNNNNNNV